MRPTRNLLVVNIALTVALTVGATACASSGSNPPAVTMANTAGGQRDAAVDSIVQDRMLRGNVSGAAVVVMSNGRVLKSTGYGIANQSTGERVGPKTAFFIASITKAFSAAMVLGLVEEGRLRLADSVINIVPGLPASWRGITVRHLLSFTSGLPENSPAPEHGLSYAEYQHALSFAAGKPLLFQPGEVFHSTSTEWVLLGKVVEQLTARSFAEAVRVRLFEPLRLRSAHFGDWRDVREGRAEWYSTLQPPTFSTVPRFLLRTEYYEYHWPAAGIFITAEDLAAFVDALGTGRVLGQSGSETYWQPASLNDGTRRGTVLGSWAPWAGASPPGRVVSHEGGARAGVVYDRDARLIVVVLTNTQGSLPLRWIDDIRALYP